ncbi:isoamyl acetate-hydrolyzing esterase 1 homolog isoform X4 [Mirounga angustirostris]|uniref:isoamyl acetate-hydrolyzing esterase 1 homolog isoform X4 n=1 Tax=Mirounga angustirostris TaxID=9716 RepID=UPI00313D72EB
MPAASSSSRLQRPFGAPRQGFPSPVAPGFRVTVRVAPRLHSRFAEPGSRVSFLSSRVDGEHHWLTGWSGYNTRWAKIILPRLIRKGNSLDSPVAVTIFFGANDSALKDENPKQHIPLAEYVANLESMVGYLQEAGVPRSRVVLITPPPLCEAAWEQECLLQGCKLNRLNSVVGEYAGACLQVAQDCGVDVLDLWTLMQKDSQLDRGSQKPCGTQGPGLFYQQVEFLLMHRVHLLGLCRREELEGWLRTSHPICRMDCTCHQREMSFCSPTFGP